LLNGSEIFNGFEKWTFGSGSRNDVPSAIGCTKRNCVQEPNRINKSGKQVEDNWTNKSDKWGVLPLRSRPPLKDTSPKKPPNEPSSMLRHHKQASIEGHLTEKTEPLRAAAG
jgi:hypothetical protein